MKNAWLLGVLSLLASATTPALAKGEAISYDFIEASYHWYEPENSDLDLYGYSLDVSGQIAPYLFFAASYTYSRTENFISLGTRGYQEFNEATAGIGAKWTAVPANQDLDGLDLIGTVDFVYADSVGAGGFEGSGGEYDRGYRLGVALRAGFFRGFEIEPGFRYGEIANEDLSEGYIQLRGRIYGPIWLVGGYTRTDEEIELDEWNLGVRFHY